MIDIQKLKEIIKINAAQEEKAAEGKHGHDAAIHKGAYNAYQVVLTIIDLMESGKETCGCSHGHTCGFGGM